MIILFHPWLDKFYCIGTKNKLKMICYDLFFYSKKIIYYQLNKDNTKKQKIDVIMVVAKKNLVNIMKIIQKFWWKKQ